jgi:transposase InsO family protein
MHGLMTHHSDRGSQYVSIRDTERLLDAGIEPSVGSVGDSCDNALAETVIGLFKTEVIHRRSPWRPPEAVEYATRARVDWYNTRRLLEPIGNMPLAAAAARSDTQLETIPNRSRPPWRHDPSRTASGQPGAVQHSGCR